MKLNAREWARWTREIETVKADVRATVNDRAIFQNFNELLRTNQKWIDDHYGGYFCQFVVRAYVASVALGVRRQIKNNDTSISLVRTMSQLRGCARQLSLDFYLEQFPPVDDGRFEWQKPTFKCVSRDGKVASEEIIGVDIDELRALSARVEAFADKQLAHLDKNGIPSDVTFAELDAAIDKLDDIACKYICLLTGKGYSTLQATVQFDWKRIFSVPFRAPG